MNAPIDQLSQYLESIGPAAVAVSGGVDSMTLGVLAHRVNQHIEIFHAISPAVPIQATQRVKQYAEREKWNLKIIDAGEIEDADYLANPANRCYFCKTSLYDTIVNNTTSLVLSGTNLDDLTDYRPGLVAAKEHQVAHPYVECEISKVMLREIAKTLGLDDLHDLPAAPCLSSRIETGIPISPQILPIVNDVEQGVWEQFGQQLDLQNVRCRIRKEGVVLELTSQKAVAKQTELNLKQFVTECFAATEFTELTREIKIEPYVQGSAFLKNNLAVDVTPQQIIT